MSTGKPQLAFGLLLPMLIWALADWTRRKPFVHSLGVSVIALLGLSEIGSPHWAPGWLASLRAYTQYHRSPSIIVYFLGDKAGLAVSGILLLGLIAVLWLRPESNLLFHAALSTVVAYLLFPEQAYSAIVLLIPTIWVADNACLIKDAGPAHQLALAAVRVSLVELWFATLLGAVCLHASTQAKAIAWWIPVNATFPLLASLTAMMIVQLLFCRKK